MSHSPIIEKGKLFYNNKEYKVRYFTTHDTTTGEEGELLAILDTDELFGRFGDEFPMSKVENFVNGKLLIKIQKG